MKKTLLLLAMIIGLSASVMARGSYAHDASVLPQAARYTIANNFKAKVSVVKIEKTFSRIDEYEAILTDGTEITFDSKGNWDNIETSNKSAVPKAFIPEAIRSFVAKNQPGTRVVGIDKERNGYDIDLSNGLDLKFDKNGQFIRYDD